jgi:hypothetical protein
MKYGGFSANRRVEVMRRVALTACPPEDRPWVRAMFAEIDAVEGRWSRLTWVMGAIQFVASRNLGRGARVLAHRLHLAIAFALCASILSVAFYGAEYEGFGIDDDSFIVLAASFAAISLGLIVIARLGSTRPPPFRKA